MLVDMGLDPYRIDKIIAGFGMPMGPFRSSESSGERVHSAIGGHVGSSGFKVDVLVACAPICSCLPCPTHRLSDLVGADIGLHVGKNFLESFSKRCYPARIIQLLNENKRLGEKSGRGFYKYDARRRASPDPDLAPLVQQSRKVGPRQAWHALGAYMHLGFCSKCSPLRLWRACCSACTVGCWAVSGWGATSKDERPGHCGVYLLPCGERGLPRH